MRKRAVATAIALTGAAMMLGVTQRRRGTEEGIDVYCQLSGQAAVPGGPASRQRGLHAGVRARRRVYRVPGHGFGDCRRNGGGDLR